MISILTGVVSFHFCCFFNIVQNIFFVCVLRKELPEIHTQHGQSQKSTSSRLLHSRQCALNAAESPMTSFVCDRNDTRTTRWRYIYIYLLFSMDSVRLGDHGVVLCAYGPFQKLGSDHLEPRSSRY